MTWIHTQYRRHVQRLHRGEQGVSNGASDSLTITSTLPWPNSSRLLPLNTPPAQLQHRRCGSFAVAGCSPARWVFTCQMVIDDAHKAIRCQLMPRSIHLASSIGIPLRHPPSPIVTHHPSRSPTLLWDGTPDLSSPHQHYSGMALLTSPHLTSPTLLWDGAPRLISPDLSSPHQPYSGTDRLIAGERPAHQG